MMSPHFEGSKDSVDESDDHSLPSTLILSDMFDSLAEPSHVSCWTWNVPRLSTSTFGRSQRCFAGYRAHSLPLWRWFLSRTIAAA